MRIELVKITNFRLLTNIELELENETTLIVGRNNCGKTSLAEVMRRFLDGNGTFKLEDFSYSCFENFCMALEAFYDGKDEGEIRAILPAIEMRLLFKYDPDVDSFGSLSPFAISLDESSNEILAVIRYELKDGRVENFFAEHPPLPFADDKRLEFFDTLKQRIPVEFETKIWAEDPGDETNRQRMEPKDLRGIVRTGFVNAQRGLDDVTSHESDILAKVLESLFKTATLPTANDEDKNVAAALSDAVKSIQKEIDTNFKDELKNLMPSLYIFGYPGLGGQEFQTETILDVNRLLSNFTKVKYSGRDGIALPESYNGLGVRNLIFILLQLIGFYKKYKAEAPYPPVHLIFIEEPEAHLHPQMQAIFIQQLANLAAKLVEDGDKIPWPVQFVVSTHSSHVSNAVSFRSIRYFLAHNAEQNGVLTRATKIKNLRNGLTGVEDADRAFLHQYLTLTKCDLFFADKAILIEGPTERLMLPTIIEKIETANPEMEKLSQQYLTVLEVGGFYAHLFFDLLEFLELPTLIITDFDSVRHPERTKCPVHQGHRTSNPCLKKWFTDDPLTPDLLLAKGDEEKVLRLNRIAYQCPETVGGPCGRTFEDAFLLANQTAFEITGDNNDQLELSAFTKAADIDKTEFAIKHAINELNWGAPKYIVDGLLWLSTAGVITTPGANNA